MENSIVVRVLYGTDTVEVLVPSPYDVVLNKMKSFCISNNNARIIATKGTFQQADIIVDVCRRKDLKSIKKLFENDAVVIKNGR